MGDVAAAGSGGLVGDGVADTPGDVVWVVVGADGGVWVSVCVGNRVEAGVGNWGAVSTGDAIVDGVFVGPGDMFGDVVGAGIDNFVVEGRGVGVGDLAGGVVGSELGRLGEDGIGAGGVVPVGDDMDT